MADNRAIQLAPAVAWRNFASAGESNPCPTMDLPAASARILIVVPPNRPPMALIDEALQHEPALRGYLNRRFRTLNTDDILQESYLRLLKQQPAAGQVASAKSYIFAVARNVACRLFRRRRIYSGTPVNELDDAALVVEAPDAAENAEVNDRLNIVAAAIDRLPSQCRTVIQLALLHGLSTAEIAARLGCAEATVRVQLARGVRKCSDFLSSQDQLR